MKTLKTLSVVFLLAIVTLGASAKGYNKSVTSTREDLKTLIASKFQSDISKIGNYLYENDVKSINNQVKIQFYVNENGVIKVLKVESDNGVAEAYAKHLLDNSKIDIAPTLAGQKYSLNLTIKYKAI